MLTARCFKHLGRPGITLIDLRSTGRLRPVVVRPCIASIHGYRLFRTSPIGHAGWRSSCTRFVRSEARVRQHWGQSMACGIFHVTLRFQAYLSRCCVTREALNVCALRGLDKFPASRCWRQPWCARAQNNLDGEMKPWRPQGKAKRAQRDGSWREPP